MEGSVGFTSMSSPDRYASTIRGSTYDVRATVGVLPSNSVSRLTSRLIR